MKSVLVIVVSTFLIFSAGYLLDSSSIPTEQTQDTDRDELVDIEIKVPDFKYTLLDGTVKQISELKGKIIILNFWASWCGPCKEEFPEMLNIVKENKDVVLVAISNDSSKKDVLKFIKKMKKENIDLNQDRSLVAHDIYKEVSSELFNVLRLPETFIIDRNFKIVKKVIGSHYWVNKEMAKFIKGL